MNKIDISKLLNQYVADTAVIFIKLHNIHWNIVGEDFMRLHEYTEELYQHFFNSYDGFAEALRITNQKVYGSMKDYLQVATIKELGINEIRGPEALDIILNDFEMLLITVKTLRNLSHTLNDITTTLMAEEEISFLEKNIWFITTMLK
jgi:starvation-inducible DNA-binding protein